MKDNGDTHWTGDDLARRLHAAVQSFSIQEDDTSKGTNSNDASTGQDHVVSSALADVNDTATVEVVNPEEAGSRDDGPESTVFGKSYLDYSKRGTTRAFPYATRNKYPVDPDKIEVVKMLNSVSDSFQKRLDAEAAARRQIEAEFDKLQADRAAEHELWECQITSLRAQRDALTKQLAEAKDEAARKDEELKDIAKRMTHKMEEALKKKDEEIRKIGVGGQHRLNHLVCEKDDARTKSKEAHSSSFGAGKSFDASPPGGVVATHQQAVGASRKGSKQARAA